MRIVMNTLRVWQRADDVVLDNTRNRRIVLPHHPDRPCRPTSRPGALDADNLQHALAWKVFRLSLRSGSRSGPKVNVRGVGLMCWADLAAILQDCEESRVLSDIERALAGNALTWLAEVGIVPTAELSI
jgi:hypothetical protein